MTLQLRVADGQGQSALLLEGRIGAVADIRVMADIVNATTGLGWRTCRRDPASLA